MGTTPHSPLSASDLHQRVSPRQDPAQANDSQAPAPSDLDAHRNRLELQTAGIPTEIRRDYLHEYYVLIAPKRAGRPYDAASHDHPLVETASSPRLDLQPEIMTIPDENGGWSVKVVENKFPALTLDNQDAYGKQEIVIDTPLSNTAFGDLSVEQITRVLSAYRQRTESLRELEHIKYVAIFRNDGYEAGASLAHAHSQIFALPFAPPRLRDEGVTVERYFKERGRDPYDDIIRFEQSAKSRIITETSDWLCFAPYAPLWQMEVWVIPKRNVIDLPGLRESEMESLATILQLLTGRLNAYLINYNLSIDQGLTEHQRLTIKLRGRNVVSPWGGLEVSTGIIINTIPSESAAEWYRRQD